MGRPKGNKTGSVFFNKSKGKWFVAYYVLDSNSHKEIRKQKTVKNEEEGKNFLSTLQYQKGNEIFVKNNGIPLSQLMRSNLQRKLDMNLIKERQYSRVLKTIQVIEKSDIANKKIEDVTSDDIQLYLNSLKDYSNSYIKKIMEQFTQSYNLAMNKGYIVRNPMLNVIKPKSTKADKDVRAMTIEEQQAFTNYLMDKTIEEEPYKNVFLIQLYTGLRVSEALALRSGDIDLKNNLINVNKTLTTDKNEKVIMGDTTKTYSGLRQVPVPEFIRNSIIEQVNIAVNNVDKQLFLSSNGNYIDNRNVNIILKKILADLEITGITTHSLRHTYATRCIEAGMRDVVLKRLLGHKDIATTLNTYTSVFNRYKEEELEKVNEYYANKNIIEQEQKLIANNPKNLDSNVISEKRKQLIKMFNLLYASSSKFSILDFAENVEFLKEQEKLLNEEER